MNLLVTGGAGFIGSHFVLGHVKQYPDDAVVVLDKLTYAGSMDFLKPVEKKIAFVQGDIVDQKLLSSVVEKYRIECIINFAAETHVDNSIKEAAPFLHTNVMGLHSLIEVCRAHPGLKLYHISTDEVYGDLADNDPPFGTDAALRPSSPYAASKAAGDLLLMAAMRTYQLPICISRCTNNYGPHQAEEKFIPTIIRQALKDQPVPVYAKGKNKRDWLYVTDHCAAIELILHTPWAFFDDKIQSGHIFNISADSEQENITVAKKVLDLLGKPHSLIQFVTDRPGHDWRYSIDSSAVRKLGWKPKVSFDQGLAQTVEWYRNQSDRY